MALKGLLPILSVADSIESLLGFTADDYLSGRVSLLQQIHPHDSDIADMLFSSADPGTSGNFNIRLRHADGRIHCISGQYSKVLDAEGPVLNLLLQDAKTLKRTLSDASATVNFTAMMENTDDYIYFKDRHHVFTGASQTLVSLCDPAEHWTDLLGQTDYDVFPEEYADIYYRLEKQIFSGMPVAQEIQETLTKDGRKGWIDNRKYPIRDEHGDIIGLFGIARDITERKQAEAALQEKERLLLESQRIAHIGGWSWAFTGPIQWTDETYRLYGVSPETFSPTLEALVNLVHPEDRQVMREWVRACGAGEKPAEFEFRCVWPDGTVRFLSGRGERINDAENRSTYIFGTVQDITVRKQLEIERQKFFLLAESSSEFIGMCDLDMNPLYVNPAGRRMVGLQDMAAACRVKVQDYYFPEDQRFIAEEFFPRVLREGHGDLEIRLRHFQTGEPIWMFYYLFSVHDASGTPIGWATTSHDITERKRAALLLAESESQRLAEMSASIDFQRQAARAALSLMEDAVAARQQAERLGATLTEQLDELSRWQQVTLNRESRILSVKKEINDLLAERGLPPRYPSTFDEGAEK